MASKRKISILLIIALAFIAWLIQYKSYQVKSLYKLQKSEEKELILLASKSLETLDVPVGAIVIYKDKIIGKGFNTVNKDEDITGHAEINALNDVVKQIGIKRFNSLDRNDLILVSTFEPCEMCKGAMIHYNIKKVVFLKDKKLTHWWKIMAKSIRFEWLKQKAANEPAQDSLFRLHPEFPGKK
ncbi:MAG: nucleoside deaminase [Bacteroidales bacterium]|nr:nucleoside deaminase [Bacteroidales bacterium]MCF8405009.1 nucleoside deaminase [Bacteroidales bacterium]